MPPKLLALDISSHVGHCRLQRGVHPRFGTLRLQGDIAGKHGRFDDWLEQQHRDEPIDGLAWERPLITPTDTVDLLELLYGLVGLCYSFVHRHALPWREVSVQQVKITVTGTAKADKNEMLRCALEVQDWKVATHHEADAGGVGVWAYEQLWPVKVAA